MGKLKQLRVLSLPFNDLHGEIPAQVWGLESLQMLDLEGNHISGNFSAFDFDLLRKLRVLNLGSNRIFGKFPTTLSKCQDLRIINLAHNEISGDIPRFIGGLRNLRYLNLISNRLTCTSVPCSSDQMVSRYVYIWFCSFSRSAPSFHKVNILSANNL